MCRDLEQGPVILGIALNVFVLAVLTWKSSQDDDTIVSRLLPRQLSSSTRATEREQWTNQDSGAIGFRRLHTHRICRRAQVP